MKDVQLLEQSLFLGMSETEISAYRAEGLISVNIVAKGTCLAEAGTRCEKIVSIVEGALRCVTFSDDKSYEMEEILQAPVLIGAERLFGLNQRHVSTYVAARGCTIVSMSKADVVALMERSMIFRTNFLNQLSTGMQRVGRLQWHQQSDDIVKRVIRFINDHSLYPAGHKILHISMNAMARELGCSRLEVSQAFHTLECAELIIMKRLMVEVPNLRQLLAFQ